MGWFSPELNEKEVREGRMKEIEQLMEFGVFEPVRKSEADGTVLTSRWVDVQKCGFVRSRLVAREYATDKRDDTFAATTVPSTSRLIDLKSVQFGQPTMSFDVSVAFIHAPETENVFLVPPQEWQTGKDEPYVWRLR